MPNTYSTLPSLFSGIANAIRSKTGGSSEIIADDFPEEIAAIPTGATIDVESITITENGTTIAPEGVAYSPIMVNVSAGRESVESKDVNFYDYDGIRLYSYTTAEFAVLTAMPENPSHDGLIAQGWNWTLSDAKTYVATYNMLDIGQIYKTTDGKTYLHIYIDPQTPENRRYPSVNVWKYQGQGSGYTIDFGNGQDPQYITANGCPSVIPSSALSIGDNIITIEPDVDTTLYIATQNPNVGNDGYGSLIGKTNTQKQTSYQNTLISVKLGDNIRLGPNSFEFNDSLLNISLSPTSVPDRSVRSAFRESSLKFIIIPTNFTTIPDHMFYQAHITHISLPNTITTIDSQSFYGSKIEHIVIPETVTTINASAFTEAKCLKDITIPKNVTTIGGSCFSNCYSLAFIRFTSLTPPALGNSSVFTSLPTDCIIYIPAGTLEDYTTATNYPSSSTYTYVEYTPA